MISRSAFFSSPNGMIGDSPPPGYVPNSGYRSGGASDPNCPACFHRSIARVFRQSSAPLRRRLRVLSLARVLRFPRRRRGRSAKIRFRRRARDRTLKADFFAGALALVRRATTEVSILRAVVDLGAAATRAPVNVDANMVSVVVC